MVQTSRTAHTSGSPESCLNEETLQRLLDDDLSASEQAGLVEHLDGCPACQARLEAAAGDPQTWSAAGRISPRPAPAPQALIDTLRTLDKPTQASDGAARGEEGFEFLTPCDAPDRIGSLGRYEIVETLGRGGMGVVFKAFDRTLDRFVAVKVVASRFADSPVALQRFRREARAAAAVKHENVVAIHAIEEAGQRPHLVMEYVAGSSLESRLQAGARPDWPEIARIGAEIARGLAAAHTAGLIHRDVKPANVLLEDGTGRVKITDFGLARSLEDGSLTHDGCVSGTPEYISPEQAEGTPIDHRADLFSLGSVLYALSAGRPPFAADNPLAVLRRTRDETPTPLARLRPELPTALIAVVEKLLSKRPADRFSTAAEVAEALGAIGSTISPVADESIRGAAGDAAPQARPHRWRLTLVLCAAALVALGLSEASGVTGVLSATLAQLGSDQVAEQPAAPAAGAEHKQPSAPPTRVQIVSPDALFRESIQAEKDRLPQQPPPHLVRSFEGHSGPVKSLAFTPDGRFAASVSGWPVGDRSVRVWDVAGGNEVRRFETQDVPQNRGKSGPREAPGEFHTVAITPDGKLAITGGTGGAVCIFDVATGKLLRQFTGHATTVYSVAVSPKGNLALSGGRESIVRLWDLSTGEERLQLAGHKSWVRSVAFSPDGKRAATGGLDGVVRLWDLENAGEVRQFNADDGWVGAVAFTPSGERIVSASSSRVRLWDAETGVCLRTFRGHGGDVTGLDVSPDGRRIISAGYDQMVRLWDVDADEPVETFAGHRDWVWTVKFAPDGRTALSAGGGRNAPAGGLEPGIDFALRLWELPKPEPRVVKPNPKP